MVRGTSRLLSPCMTVVRAAGSVLLRLLRSAMPAAVVAAVVAAAGAASAQPATESRLALVIGNSSYKQSPLPNAVPDARLMEAVLKESGFEVIKAENATLRDMRRLVRDFGDRLSRSGGVGLFYYAGHGVQVRGDNYLVSVDSDIRNEDEIADDSITAQLVLSKMETARNRVNLIILDACRNNPFATRTRSVSNGLAIMTAPSGSLVAYSTAPGSVAEDGTGTNGLYTKHLARVMRQAGLPVEEVFKRVRAAVRIESSNRQTPWENTALEGQFFFKAAAPVAAPSAPSKPAPPTSAAVDSFAMELAFWEAIKTSTQKADLEEYLKQFPDGRFAGLVRNRINTLDAAAVRPPAPAPAPAATPPPVVARIEPPVAAALPTRAPAFSAGVAPFVAVGDRLAYRDFDSISGASVGNFSRLVTKRTDTGLELDGGALVLSQSGPGSVRSGSVPEVLGAAPKQLVGFGKWTGEFHTAQRVSESRPLELQFEKLESRTISDKPVTLVRVAVRGFASRNGVLGHAGSAGGMIRGFVLAEQETGVVVEVNLTSPHPHYALRRQLVSVDRAAR